MSFISSSSEATKWNPPPPPPFRRPLPPSPPPSRRVLFVQPTYPASKVLRRGDVIMKVDGIRVSNDGSIPFRAGERVALKYYMSQLFPEDEVG